MARWLGLMAVHSGEYEGAKLLLVPWDDSTQTLEEFLKLWEGGDGAGLRSRTILTVAPEPESASGSHFRTIRRAPELTGALYQIRELYEFAEGGPFGV